MLDELNAEQLLDLIDRFGEFLVDNSVKADLLIVGGAALISQYGELRATSDIDSIIQTNKNQKQRILKLATDFAKNNQLDMFWFNDEVEKVKPPKDDEKAKVIFDTNGLKIRVASLEYLLAMKINAFRPDSRDLFDAVFLCKKLGTSKPDAIHKIYLDVYGNDDGVKSRIFGIANEIERQSQTKEVNNEI